MLRWFFRIYRLADALQGWVRLRLTPAGQLVAAGLAITAAFGVNTHINLAHQMFTFLLALAVIALAAGRFFDAPLRIRRTLPRYGTVGEPFAYRIQVVNRGRRRLSDLSLVERIADGRPTWDEFRQPSPGAARRPFLDRFSGFSRWRRLCREHTAARVSPGPAVDLAPGGAVDLVMRLTPLRRGRLILPGPAATRPEPLGLFRCRRVLAAPGNLLVLPRLYRLKPALLPGRRRFQPGGVALASSVGDAEEFVSLRDYRPGDPRRRIHWKSWAKTGKPIVKEYQEEFFVRHALVLDTFGPQAGDPVFEEAVSLAASFVVAQCGDTLLDLMFVGPEAYCFTSGRGLAHTDRMLEILAGVAVCRDKPFSSLEPLMLRRAGLLSACIMVLLGWDADRRRLAGILQQLGLPLEIFVVTAPGGSAAIDPGPMQDRPERFHVLDAGRIQQGLDRL